MTVGPVQRDEATAAFFDAAASGQFLLRRCPDGHSSEPQAAHCTTCGRTDLDWAPAGGGATLVSWAVTWGRASADGEPDRTVLAIGELDEGPWWWAQLAGADPAELSVGQRLRIGFRSAGEEYEHVPVFILA
jgi:uncharacterized OB-fold protein